LVIGKTLLSIGQSLASDWPAYPPSFTAIYQGKRPWESFIALRRASLVEVARKHGLGDLSDDDLTEINAIWRRIEPWPDTTRTAASEALIHPGHPGQRRHGGYRRDRETR
jgi:hypothetical protein